MTDRPVIFSAAMVLALLAGRKTQTRRLATSPLRRCERGDRLYVRECFAEVAEGRLCITRADYPACVPPSYENVPAADDVTWRPSIHMPRRLSRLTLIVEDVRFQRLQEISESDARAEGIEHFPSGTPQTGCPFGVRFSEHGVAAGQTAVEAYSVLWALLHGADSWAANPEVVALTFRVVPGNIDRLPA